MISKRVSDKKIYIISHTHTHTHTHTRARARARVYIQYIDIYKIKYVTYSYLLYQKSILDLKLDRIYDICKRQNMTRKML